MRKLLILLCVLQMTVLFTGCNHSEPQQNVDPTSPNTSPGNNPSGTYVVGTVSDICGNTYNYIKIGNQYWMAENLRCNKYDTKSEMTGKTLLLKPSKSLNYDWSKDSGWDVNNGYLTGPYYRVIYDDYLEERGQPNGLALGEIKKWGYAYNWGAAVGLVSGEDAFKETTELYRQGICPNGWHIPTKREWNVLIKFVKEDIGFSGLTGKCLKSQTGWLYIKGSNENLDRYGFNAIPAASSNYDMYYGKSEVTGGSSSNFWTASSTAYDRNSTGNAYGSTSAIKISLNHVSDNVLIDDYGNIKNSAYSVRCIKD